MRLTRNYLPALCLLMAVIIFSACKTKDDTNPGSYWIMNGVTYAVNTSQTSKTGSYNLVAGNALYNSAILMFGNKPLSDGSILIGSDTNELLIYVTIDGGSGADKSYTNEHQPATALRATYTFLDGKITVDVPEILLRSSTSSAIVKFSAHITEQ